MRTTIRPTTFYLILFVIVLAEVLFFFKDMQARDSGMFGAISKSTLVVVLLYFAYYGMNWSRWILMVLFSILALGCMLAFFGDGDWSFIPIAACYMVGVIGVYRMKPIIVPLATPGEDATTNEPLPPGTFRMQGLEFSYPSLTRRYAASLVDLLFGWFVMVITMVAIDDHPNRLVIMITLAAALLLGYDPLLTAYSATIGQRLMKIRVRNYNDPSQRISLWRAYFRIVVKTYLGIISFFTIHSNVEHRAIHDFAGASVVVNV